MYGSFFVRRRVTAWTGSFVFLPQILSLFPPRILGLAGGTYVPFQPTAQLPLLNKYFESFPIIDDEAIRYVLEDLRSRLDYGLYYLLASLLYRSLRDL